MCFSRLSNSDTYDAKLMPDIWAVKLIVDRVLFEIFNRPIRTRTSVQLVTTSNHLKFPVYAMHYKNQNIEFKKVLYLIREMNWSGK